MGRDITEKQGKERREGIGRKEGELEGIEGEHCRKKRCMEIVMARWKILKKGLGGWRVKEKD